MMGLRHEPMVRTVRVRAMRCMACGAEMILMNVVPDDRMIVPGFEHHAFMCSDCGEVERRFVFNSPPTQHDIEAVTVDTAPPISPTSPAPDDAPAAPGLLRGVLAKFRGR